MSQRSINEITEQILGAAFQVYTELGPGLLESAYEACLLFELHERRLEATAQLKLPVVYKSVTIDSAYRIDLLVEDLVIVEVKAVDKLMPVHSAQLLSYLRLAKKPVGLLINFHSLSLKHGIKRLAN